MRVKLAQLCLGLVKAARQMTTEWVVDRVILAQWLRGVKCDGSARGRDHDRGLALALGHAHDRDTNSDECRQGQASRSRLLMAQLGNMSLVVVTRRPPQAYWRIERVCQCCCVARMKGLREKAEKRSADEQFLCRQHPVV